MLRTLSIGFGLGLTLLSLSLTAEGEPAKESKDPKDIKAAEAANARGMKFYLAKDFAQATAAFRAALAANPGMVLAHYNLACVAGLQGDKKTAAAELAWLKNSSNGNAFDKLRKARTDPDLAAIAGDPQIRPLLDAAEFVAKVRPLTPLKEVSATSTFVDGKQPIAAQVVVSPEFETEEGSDGGTTRYTSVWCEGKPDAGIGEGITITFTDPVELDGISIVTGDWRSQKNYRSRNQITALEVELDDSRKLTAVPPKVDAAGLEYQWSGTDNQAVAAVGGQPVRKVAVRIAKVKQGKKNDSCITAIYFNRKGQRMPAIFGVSAAALAALPKGVAKVVDAVVGLEPSVMNKYIEFPLSYCSKGDYHEASCTTSVWKDAAALRSGCVHGRNCMEQVEGNGPDDLELTPIGPATVSLRMAGYETWSLIWRSGEWRLKEVRNDHTEF